MVYRAAASVQEYAFDMTGTRTFSPLQIGFAALVVTVFAVLTFFDKVSADATIALVSGITGAVLAAPLGARAAHEEGRATGTLEGVEAATAAANGGDSHVAHATAPALVTSPQPPPDAG
jgi:hypothetical protein